MPQRLFVFLQLEFPWTLGPTDGRYLLRKGPEAEAENVVVFDTVGAARAADGAGAGRVGRAGSRGLLGRRSGATREREATPEPASVSTTRVTVIDPVSLSAELQARAWLEDLDRDHDVQAAVSVINRVVQMHRIASADAYMREVSAAQALVIRAGWGEGEQVAYGQWLHARELRQRSGPRRRRNRAWALRPQERLAALMSGRSRPLMCEELVLRARLDLDQARVDHAAVGLDHALAAAVVELTAEQRQDLALRVAELEQLRAGVHEQAARALTATDEPLDEDLLAHALGRLEACLRARTAAGI
jgi:hypothetical protein